MVDAFLADIDFLSIGTNDLAQYVMAADRTHPELADLVAPLQPALLRLVSSVVEAARSRSVPVAVCGEAAAHLLAAPLLVGLGVGALSVAPPLLAGLRQRLSTVPFEACREAAAAVLQASSLSEVERIAEGMG
jgi:phosphotransferase system enzyme I (PtsI)